MSDEWAECTVELKTGEVLVRHVLMDQSDFQGFLLLEPAKQFLIAMEYGVAVES